MADKIRKREPLYCAKGDCLELATFIVEGTSLCDDHLVEQFKSTSLEIARVGARSINED